MSGAHDEQHPSYLPQPSWWCTVLCSIVQPSDDSNTGTGCGQAVYHGLQRLLHCRPPEARQTCWQRISVFLDMPTCPHHLEEVFNFCEEIGRHCTNCHGANLMKWYILITVNLIGQSLVWLYTHNVYFLSYHEYDHAVLYVRRCMVYTTLILLPYVMLYPLSPWIYLIMSSTCSSLSS